MQIQTTIHCPDRERFAPVAASRLLGSPVRRAGTIVGTIATAEVLEEGASLLVVIDVDETALAQVSEPKRLDFVFPGGVPIVREHDDDAVLLLRPPTE